MEIEANNLTKSVVGNGPQPLQAHALAAKKERGQGMTEYIIIVGVIAIAAISVFGLFGDTVEQQISGMAQELAGGNGQGAQQAATQSANNALTDANTTNNLGNYHGNNGGGGN